jgi:predicted HTH domain antitoxin
MSIRFDVPSDLERELRAAGVDLDREAREDFFVGLYRRGSISQARLGAVLGLDRFETDALLKRQGVEYGQTLQSFREEAEMLRGLEP